MQEGQHDAAEGPASLEGLYDAHAAWMYRHAAMILADRAAAEDAVQQVFVKLAAMGARRPAMDSAGAYLRQAVRGECYRILERRRKAPVSQPLLEGSTEENRPHEEREELEAALRKLPPEQREVVHLKVYESMTFEQVAAVLDIPPNTAASRYRYAIEKLREMMKRD